MPVRSLNRPGEKRPLLHQPKSRADLFFEDLRSKEFERLDRANQIYLDYTGGNLYSISLPTTKADFEKFFSFAAQFLDKKISPEVFKQKNSCRIFNQSGWFDRRKERMD